MPTCGERLISTLPDSRIRQCHSLIEREDYARAWPIASSMLNDNPDDPRGLYFAGWILRSQGHIGMALHMFSKALALERSIPNIWMHYGACLHDTHQYEDAREAFRLVHKALPADPMPAANIAATYVQEGRANQAIEWADKALGLNPDNRIAKVAKAYGCLSLGRWSEGWKHVEALYGEAIMIRVYKDPEHEEPMWDGSPGKTVVVQADQGLGDVLMFAQCLKEMVRDCKKVIIDCDPRLLGLFKRNFPECDVYGTMKEEHNLKWPLRYDIDAHIPISYLGRFYRKSDADFPRLPYLTPDPIKVEKWTAWLRQFPRPWIGIAWRGGIQRSNEAARSMELREWAPILESGGSFVSLAYQDVAAEIARWNIDNATQVAYPTIDNDGDYDEWLALASALDHVICTTTTIAHVRGALGKRASVMVNQTPQWRYGYGGDSLLWYPENSVRLYRQKPGEKDWRHCIARVAKDYQTWLSLCAS